MSETNILRSCPFCGGEADKWKGAYWHVGCSIPGCAGYACQNDDYDTEAEAIEAWNTRANVMERTCEVVNKQDEWQYNCGTKDYMFSCGHVIAWAHTYEPSFCPNCGAKVVSA